MTAPTQRDVAEASFDPAVPGPLVVVERLLGQPTRASASQVGQKSLGVAAPGSASAAACTTPRLNSSRIRAHSNSASSTVPHVRRRRLPAASQ
jgi:hypothetical protein